MPSWSRATRSVMSDPLHLVLSRLPSAREHGKGWQAKCPSHDDQHASLSIGTGTDGRVLLRCHAGCDTSTVVAALGLTMHALFPETRQADEPETVFDYRDESNVLLFQVVRFSGKRFRQRRPNGTGGYEWNLNGCRRVLF